MRATKKNLTCPSLSSIMNCVHAQNPGVLLRSCRVFFCKVQRCLQVYKYSLVLIPRISLESTSLISRNLHLVFPVLSPISATTILVLPFSSSLSSYIFPIFSYFINYHSISIVRNSSRLVLLTILSPPIFMPAQKVSSRSTCRPSTSLASWLTLGVDRKT